MSIRDPICPGSVRSRYESKRAGGSCVSAREIGIDAADSSTAPVRASSWCVRNQCCAILRTVPLAPKPSSATEITIYAKWYH